MGASFRMQIFLSANQHSDRMLYAVQPIVLYLPKILQYFPSKGRLIKPSRVTRGLIVFGPFPPSLPSPPPPFCQHFFNFLEKPWSSFLQTTNGWPIGVGNFWHPFRWPWVKVTKLPKRNAIYLVPTVKCEPLIQSLQNMAGIFPSSCFPLD